MLSRIGDDLSPSVVRASSPSSAYPRVEAVICPLTGSSLGFDRAPVGGAEFGVTGLLY